MPRKQFTCALAIIAFATWPVEAKNRHALLIGNQDYPKAVGRLANPINDINLIETALRRLDFRIARVENAALGEMYAALSAHSRRVRRAGPGAISFLYYSGHGAQDATTRTNYLIPTDVSSIDDARLWDQSLRLTDVTRQLREQAGNASHFVVFDACRNVLKVRKAGAKALVQSKGFIAVPKVTGMLIAYATASGETASDVGAGSGPYAQALAAELVRPGVEAVTMFRNVQITVFQKTGQEPWLDFGYLGRIYLAGKLAPGQKVPEADMERMKDRLAALQKELEKKRAPGPAAKREYRAGDTFRDCPACPEMVVLPDTGRIRRIAVSKFEITFENWIACTRDDDCGYHRPKDHGWGRGRRPVIYVSKIDAELYANWLSRTAKATYRLPTDREWMYAAQAGEAQLMGPLSSKSANFDDSVRPGGTYLGKTAQVGSYPANRFGLHDMAGNVAEWVQEGWAKGGSWYDDRKQIAPACAPAVFRQRTPACSRFPNSTRTRPLRFSKLNYENCPVPNDRDRGRPTPFKTYCWRRCRRPTTTFSAFFSLGFCCRLKLLSAARRTLSFV